MKKTLKKMIKLSTLLLMVVASLLPTSNVSAETILNGFKTTYKTIETPISFPTNFHVIKTTEGKHVFCMQYNLKVPSSNVTYTKGTLITDNGLNYILNQAYTTKSDREHFVYKSAMWLYMVDKGLMQGGTNNLKTYYQNVKNSKTTEAKKILELIANAKKAGANDTSAPTIKIDKTSGGFHLDETGKYYVSDRITVVSSKGGFNIDLKGATRNTSKETQGSTFVIKVPVEEVTDLVTEITFTVSNSKEVYTSYKYNPNNNAYQPLAATFKETKTASASGKLTLTKNASVPFLKVDADTNEALAGAELRLTDSAGNEVDKWTSETEAKVIEGLKEGTYTLTETKAPAGYQMLEKSVKFSIDSKGKLKDENGKEIVQVVISNKKITYSVPFLKVDAETGNALAGAELRLTDSTGKVRKTWISGAEEEVVHGLLPGKYILTEVKAPNGYNTLETTIEFTIDESGKILDSDNNEVKIIKIANEKKTGGVLISKRDITNDKELPGAKLQITDYNGNTKEEWTWISTNEPHYIEKLEPGIYTLREIYAPNGYILSDDTKTFTIKEDGTVETVIMYNSPASKDKITVESTDSFKTMTSTIIGMITLLGGSYIIIKNSKKKENY